MDYLMLLLNTYINQKDIFLDVIQNRQLQLEKEKSISKKEFYFNCREVIKVFKNEFEYKFNERQNQLCQIIDYRESKGEPTEDLEIELSSNDRNKTAIPLLHLTSGRCTGHFYLRDINFIETSLNSLHSISATEKDQIFKEMVFEKGLFYYSDTNKSRIKQAYENLENDFETKEDFIRAVNSLLHSNGLHFYSKLRTISNETEFINYIQSQYNLYNEYTPNNSLNWLNFTKKSIMYRFGILSIENESLKASFMNWYNQTIKSITPEKPKLMDSNIFDKIVKELDLIKDIFYSQIENRNSNWNQKDEGRYCNYLCINSNENLFEISKYKNYYTNRIDKSNSALLKNELDEIHKKAFILYEYFVKELKDHKDKREVFIGNDGASQIIESTVLFIVQETRINSVFYDCDINGLLYKSFTEVGNTKKCKNETLVNFCVQLLQFIDLTGVLEKVQIDNNKQNPPQQIETIKSDEVIKLHPDHNPNDWNKDCFELFKYLFDEYYNDGRRTNTKLMCIWFYLSEYEPEKYNMRITKDNYIKFIKHNYKKTITNKDKPVNYDSKVFNNLEEHRLRFEDSLK